MLLAPAPRDPSLTRIFLQLVTSAKDDRGIVDRATKFIEVASPLVDLVIAGPFGNYTLHNRDHSKKVLHIAGELLPNSTLVNLTAADCLLLIYASYLHDMGMVLTANERIEVLSRPEFLDFLQTDEDFWPALVAARQRVENAPDPEKLAIEAEIFQLQEGALAKYLRPLHASKKRYEALITLIKNNSSRNDLFSLDEVAFEDILVDIAVSHNQNASVIAELKSAHEERFPRALPIGRHLFNAQFCAAMLRIGDILDFDRERTPKVLFEGLGIKSSSLPDAEVSLLEWNKHLSVNYLQINGEEIVVSADSRHPVIEHAIRDFCSSIEQELQETLAVFRRGNPSTYIIDLPMAVRPNIRSLGYEYVDLSLNLDEKAIIALLMGNNLYNNPLAAVRELIQNAVDACTVKAHFSLYKSSTPTITVTSKIDEDQRLWILVGDNGIGMDKNILGKYFFKVGKSYYKSVEFERLLRTHQKESFTSISRFGIGILSTFMIGDKLEVNTRGDKTLHADSSPRKLVVEKVGSIAFINKLSSGPFGTEVGVRIKYKHPYAYEIFVNELIDYVRQTVIRPPVEVKLSLTPSTVHIAPKNFYKLASKSADYLTSKGFVLFQINLEDWSSLLKGLCSLIFYKAENGGLQNKFGTTQLRETPSQYDKYPHTYDPRQIYDNFNGNRVTINGFSISVNKIGRLFTIGTGKGKGKIPSIIDVDLPARPEIDFNVMRSKIVGPSTSALRQELFEATKRALVNSPIYSSVSDEIKKTIEVEPRTADWAPPELESEEFLLAVESLVPMGPWPVGLHRFIAEQLGVAPSIVRKALYQMLEAGRISKSTE